MSDQIRNAEVNNAQSNPSILSNLSGASQPPTMQAPPSAPPQVQQATGIAQNLSSNLYGGGQYAGLTNQRDAQIQDLFNYDKMLESNYSPMPTPNWYVNNPADQSAALSTAAGIGAGNLRATQGSLSATDQAYQTAVSSVLDKFTTFAQLQQQKELEQERLKIERERLQLERDRAGAGNNLTTIMQELTGGAGATQASAGTSGFGGISGSL